MVKRRFYVVNKNGWAVVYDSKLDRTADFGYRVDDWDHIEYIADRFESGRYAVRQYAWSEVENED